MHSRVTLDLPDPEATDRLARLLARHLHGGDAVLLSGPIGAGKSHLARALIRDRLGNPAEDVPSPSFTLVQTYPSNPPIWHADLYRLIHPDEVLELGLDEAFRSAICLIEWPDRLGKDAPENAITVTLSSVGEGRQAVIDLPGRPALAAALRAMALTDFVGRSGWGAARRDQIAGDASGRGFQRLTLGDRTAVLLDNPPGLPDRLEDFLVMARHLRRIGLSAPEVLAEESCNGFALMEDLGDVLFARRLTEAPGEEAALYRLATDVLIAMQSHPAPPGLRDLSADDWADAAMLAVTQYRLGVTDEATDPSPLKTALAEAIRRLADGPRVLIHRDYFAGNLLLLPREGLARAGLIDFQLGQMGQPVYDLVSLLQDARRDVAPAVQAEMKARFVAATTMQGFEAGYAVWGVQRALRILGVFARLCRVEGRAEYLPHLPRVMRDLRRNLEHPELAEMKRLCDGLLPDPTPEALDRLRAQCGSFR
jgi:hypothetical protein